MPSDNIAVQDRFSAAVHVDGARIHIDAPALSVLAGLMARLRGTEPAAAPAPAPLTGAQFADPRVGAAYDEACARVEANEKVAAAARVAADEKVAAAGGAAAEPPKTAAKAEAPGKPQSTPAPQPEKAADTPRTAEAAAADAPSSSARTVAYDDVKRLVNALYAIKPQHAVDALAHFSVKRGQELKTEQWLPFVEHAESKLATLKAA